MRKNIVNSTINGSCSPLLGESGPFLCQNLRFLQKKYILDVVFIFLYSNASYFMKPRGEENKVHAKQNQADSNVLMRENTTEETNNLKVEFGKRIQDIEKESNEKQESKSVDEMILEQPQLLRDVNFVQQNYDAVSKAVNAQPSLM